MKKSTRFTFPALALLATLTAAGLTACFSDKVTEPPPLVPVAADTARNVFAFLPATTALTASNVYAFLSPAAVKNVANLRADSAAPAFTYFSLATGTAVADSNAAWDLAFRSTTIKVNGQSQFVTSGFDALAAAPEAGYAAGNVATWYDYSGEPNHTITPKPGLVLVVKTAGNKYAKIQLLSYYKGNPASPNGLADTARYYSFKYVLQPDGSRDLTPAANPAPRTFFSLRTGAVVADSTQQWDIAFRSTAITVNGQAQLVASGFDALTAAPTSGYGASVGTWYNYSGPPNHLITPKSDTILVIKTADNKYAKIQITSYYKGSPASPNGLADTARYYSFKYYLQPDGSTSLQAGTDAAPKTYFSFQTGTTVAGPSQQWDIAFRSTAITVNGQAQLLTGANFDALPEAPEAGYAAGDVPTWYDYSGSPNHTVTPKVGAVILVKTADNKYAKVQILSYYQNAPAVPVGITDVPRYYTFRYVYQTNGSRSF